MGSCLVSCLDFLRHDATSGVVGLSFSRLAAGCEQKKQKNKTSVLRFSVKNETFQEKRRFYSVYSRLLLLRSISSRLATSTTPCAAQLPSLAASPFAS